MSEPIEPDTKDWTWVLERSCPACGFDAESVSVAELAGLVDDSTPRWIAALRGDGVSLRPDPQTWSVLEYACHVRDVHRIFAGRLRQMLDETSPTFANWDQDVTALEDDYASQDPQTVTAELKAAAEDVAELYRSLVPEQHARAGLRSNGSSFTVETLGKYHLHDVVHHAHDIGWGGDGGATRSTVSAYDDAASAYAEASRELPCSVRSDVSEFATKLGRGSRVLEIGSGSGRDAELMEELGLHVRRTDISRGFVDLLRAAGHEAAHLDPLRDDLSSPAGPYDGVWANASLLHVARTDLLQVLVRLGHVTRIGGVLRVALKQGAGEGWSAHGSVAAPRFFTYWEPGPLSEVLVAAGWRVVSQRTEVGGKRNERWLEVEAVRT